MDRQLVFGGENMVSFEAKMREHGIILPCLQLSQFEESSLLCVINIFRQHKPYTMERDKHTLPLSQ